MDIDPLIFKRFLEEKEYLTGASPKTLGFYTQCATAFKRYGGVMEMKKAGLSNGGINAYIRGINSFLSWKGEERIKLLKSNPKVQVVSDEDMRKVLGLKQPLWCLLADTGVRIQEALSLDRGGVDFHNLLITVVGKSSKERIVPFSLELRKILYQLSLTHVHGLLFCTRHGRRLNYNNERRRLKKACIDLGIKPFGFHAFRRFFATHYIKSGGNPFMLQRILGHSSLHMTNQYVKLVTSDLKHLTFLSTL